MSPAETSSTPCRCWAARLQRWLRSAEILLAVVTLSVLVVMSLAAIVARDVFHTAIPDADRFPRYLVLWAGFLGAALAVPRRHITIDVASIWLSKRVQLLLERPIAAVSAVACGALCFASVGFFQMEWKYAVGPGRAAALLDLVLPVGFLLLTMHYALFSLTGPIPSDPPS